MDEWPELEALAKAVDAWDEWPLSPLYDRAQAVIDKARDVVRNYRDTLAMIAAYKAMPPVTMDTLRREGLVTEAQYRRQVGLPPAAEPGVKACIEIPAPEGYDEPCPNGCGVYVVKGYPHFNCPKEAGGDRHRDD
ncbi:hypothetical protein KNV18_gp64 [Mycobacterium phage Heath]|uniref:Uncharacterized protein n=1 Tax=Mycobacterium phage Heath TaxID=2762421 RepID=A0A7G8LFV6_9CAUD|nr:hypothetical protein KNV18_gp64 [Mycobacterium phage Heath]QNJ56128.1 hypothetical protein SEA_HEATH_64 [Mycobacterium phage Heath]